MGAALPFIQIGMAVFGAVQEAGAAKQQAQAEQNAANYRAVVARNNQISANNAAIRAGQEGSVEAAQANIRKAQTIAKIEANAAANGVLVGKGTIVDVVGDAAEAGTLEVLQARDRAGMRAKNLRDQGVNFGAQSTAEQISGENALAAGRQKASTAIIGGAFKVGGQVAKKWDTYGKLGVSKSSPGGEISGVGRS